MTGKRNRRQAALPGAGYARPASLDATGLVVTVFAEDGGVEEVLDLGRFKGSLALRKSLAACLDKRSGPGGQWRSGRTARSGYYAIKAFLDHLATLPGPPQSIEQITPAIWAAWRVSLPPTNYGASLVGRLRQVLLEAPELLPATAAVLGRRIQSRYATDRASYSHEEFDLIRGAAARTFNSALVRIRSNREHLRRWYDGQLPKGSSEFLIGEALDEVLRTGDVPVIKRMTRPGRSLRQPYQRLLGGTQPENTWGRLFLTPEEAFALAVLLVASQSWNRSVGHLMRLPDHDPAVGEQFDIHMVEVHKVRRPVRLRYTSNNLVDAGADSPGRLMSRAIEATELARQTLELLGRPTDRLLVSRLHYPNSVDDCFCLGIPRSEVTQIWAERAGLHQPDGTPIQVTLQRLRRTVQVRIRKEPAQNSPQTHESIYVLPDTATREDAQDTVAQGLTDALNHARAINTMKMVLGDDADVLTELADDPELAKAILAGTLDTATAACTDFTHSPHTEPGRPCTASFLFCLACKNAIATRRHLPRLVYLHRALEQLRATLEARIWEVDWQEHYARLATLLREHTTPAEQNAAMRSITDRDRTLIDNFLRRRFDP